MSQRGAIVQVPKGGQIERPKMAVFVAENGSSVVAFLTPSGVHRPYYDDRPEEYVVEAEPVPPMRARATSDVREVSHVYVPTPSGVLAVPPAAPSSAGAMRAAAVESSQQLPRASQTVQTPFVRFGGGKWSAPQRASVSLLVFGVLTTWMVVAWFMTVDSPWTWKSAIALLSAASSLAAAGLVWRDPSRAHLGLGAATMAFSLLRVGNPMEWTGVTAALMALTVLLAVPVVLAYLELRQPQPAPAPLRATA